ncbi:MAG: FtsX-like permease family protein [Holophagales bacterium]|nr:FtsX-like permease family protein [Holophagales bacterium]
MRPESFFRQLRREARGGGARLAFFVLCLAVGVGAVVSVNSFSSGLDSGIRKEARSLLAADLAIRSRQPIEPAFHRAVDDIPGSQRTDILEMLTVVAVEAGQGAEAAAGIPTPQAVERGQPTARSQLTEVKAVRGTYPFYGELELEPPRPLHALLDARSTVVAPELLRRLDIELGDEVRIGGETFRVSGTVLREPDRIGGAFSMGPRIFLSGEGLERAGLEQYGSRIVYRTLVALPSGLDPRLETIAEELDAALSDDSRHRLETYREAQPALRRGLERMESYLGLAALLSLVVGGVGVAQTVRAWIAGRLDAIAVQKCLGVRPREILALYLGQTFALGLISSLVGVALGIGLVLVPLSALRGIMPVEQFEPIQPLAWLQGLFLGTGVALLFAVAPLVEARRVPPIRVLRRSAQPLPPSRSTRLILALALVAGVLTLASWQSGSLLRGALFTGGLLLLGALLTGAALGLARFAARPRRRARLWLRQGLAALARPGASTVGGIAALGVGVLVVLAMFLVERGLSAELDQELPDAAPTAFLVDIQPDQWPEVRRILDDEGALAVDSVPVVMARLTALDGRSVNDIVAEREARARADRRDDGEGNWALRREQRLTYLEQLPEDNEIVSGALWSEPEVAEVSLELDFADDLGVGLGSLLAFDVQGVPMELKVTSLRTVDWSTFGINFFMVVEPGVLDDAPQIRIAAARLGEEATRTAQDRLALAFPNVTVIQIREVLERVSEILGRLGLGVRVLGGLTVLVGLAILAGAVSASSVRRGREVALYKTLGMTRAQVVAAFATEYALVGLVAGVIGAAGAGVLAWAVLTRAMEVPWTMHGTWFPAAVAATMVLSVVAGLAASTGALRKRPVEALRAAGE